MIFTRSEPVNEPKIRVLFVCVENSNRSQMAQAFAAMYGGGKSNRVPPEAARADG